MGKRKRDAVPCSSGTELSGELLNASDGKPLSPGMDVADGGLKLLHVCTSLENQHNDLGRSLLFKRSRRHYGNQYSRRNSGSRASASTSHGRTALFSDSAIHASASTSRGVTAISRDSGDNPSASTSHGETSFLRDSGNNASTSASLGRNAFLRGQDNRQMQSRRQENVRFSVMPSSAPTDVMKMVCGICDRLLRRKPYFPGETPPSSTEFSVAAVLACGHVYHADCLEERTSIQEIQDPPCPLCIGFTLVSMTPS